MSTVQPELTQRQQQILQLLQAGKVNKEVARELDIGLGTVKQHIVAIFKKLKVNNRTAAVSCNLGLRPAPGPTLPPFAKALLSRRPCVVLSMGLSSAVAPAIVSNFYAALASVAADHDAIFLTRQGNAGDVIFGVQRVTEHDVAAAIQAAYRVYQSLVKQQASVQQHLRGCLSAGVALASMHRYGGWTGEAIVSAAIASARDLLDDTSQGMFACDKSALDLCSAFGVFGISGFAEGVKFEDLAAMQWQGIRRSNPLVGRRSELTRLHKALDHAAAGQSSLVFIEGEMGMGKTRLCQELLRACLMRSGTVWHFCGLPPILGSGLCNVELGSRCSIEDAITALQSSHASGVDMVLVDDFHLITSDGQIELMRIVSERPVRGRLVVFSGRKGLCRLAPKRAKCISLRRLNQADMKALVRLTLDLPTGQRRKTIEEDILNTAIGVPMFAVEMALQPKVSDIALPLLVAVNARLDKIRLDSSLLSVVAKQTPAASMARIADVLQEDPQLLQVQVARAVESGVLSRASDGTLTFSHPMIRRVIVNSVME